MRAMRRLATLAALMLALPAAAARRRSPPTLPPPVPCPACWQPPLQTSWQWELSVVPKPPFLAVDMYDIDLFDTPASTVAALHDTRPGRRVTCYISAGSWEDWRPDAGEFPQRLLGRPLDHWPGERYLDIRRFHGALGRLMDARLDLCAAKGFDAVELDNVDEYTNRSGFRLTADDQLAYNVWLANEAHARGLSVALKNDNDQIPELAALLRLGAQRAVLPVLRLHPGADRRRLRVRRVHGRRQGGVRRRVQAAGRGLLPAGERPELQLAEEAPEPEALVRQLPMSRRALPA